MIWKLETIAPISSCYATYRSYSIPSTNLQNVLGSSKGITYDTPHHATYCASPGSIVNDMGIIDWFLFYSNPYSLIVQFVSWESQESLGSCNATSCRPTDQGIPKRLSIRVRLMFCFSGTAKPPCSVQRLQTNNVPQYIVDMPGPQFHTVRRSYVYINLFNSPSHKSWLS